VILNYNDAEETLRLLEDIRCYSEIDHIVVVDNQSTDDSLEKLKCHLDGTWDLVSAPENKGYSYGNNLGIRYLLEQYNVDVLIISNPDVQFDNDFVGEIKKQLLAHPDYAMVSGVQYGRDGKVYHHAFWPAHTITSCCLDVLKKYPLLARILKKAGGRSHLCRKDTGFP